jgi:hypothetical protein
MPRARQDDDEVGGILLDTRPTVVCRKENGRGQNGARRTVVDLDVKAFAKLCLLS